MKGINDYDVERLAEIERKIDKYQVPTTNYKWLLNKNPCDTLININDNLCQILDGRINGNNCILYLLTGYKHTCENSNHKCHLCIQEWMNKTR